jgi:hypothetical protein
MPVLLFARDKFASGPPLHYFKATFLLEKSRQLKELKV